MRAGIRAELWEGVDFICDVDWMKKHRVRGIVIWPRVMFHCSADELPTWVFRHELEHAYQIMRDGPILFYLKYFYFSLRYGYDNNPYEVEARYRQHNVLTPTEEELLWKLKGGSTP